MGRMKSLEDVEKNTRRKSSSSEKISSACYESKDDICSATTSDYDPLEWREVEHPTSNLDVIIHILKGNIGTGVFAMPDAFRNAGLVVGPVGLVLVGLISAYTMRLLVKCSHELCRRIRTPSLGFADVAEQSFKMGPERLRKFSSVARILVNVFLCLTQFGFCCVYFVFVPTNIEKFVKSQWDYDGLSSLQYIAIILPPMICLNMIRNLKLLAPVMMVANGAMALGFGIIMYYVLQDLPSVSERRAFAPIDKLPLYFGTAMFAFEGIGMILPLENSMKTPRDFGGWNGVLSVSMVLIGSLFTAVGFYGYLKYGDETEGSITLNLPKGDVLAQSVQLIMAVAIFLTYALQFYVPMNIMWPPIKEKISSERMQLILEYAFRTFLVLITFALAAAIPDLSLVISLVGALCSTTLALIFPPIISMLTYSTLGYGRYNWMLVKDIGILIVGLLGMLTGTYVSIVDIVNKS